MSSRPLEPIGARRQLRRDSDGGLYDVDQHRRVELAELREDIKMGRRFRATRPDNHADCTNEVLAATLSAVLPQRFSTGGALAGMSGGLGAIAGALIAALDDNTRNKSDSGPVEGRRTPRGLGVDATHFRRD